jgi:hypothetical protein
VTNTVASRSSACSTRFETAAHNQQRDEDRSYGHARVAADAGEFGSGGDPGELGAGGADVRQEQDGGGRDGGAMAVAVADQPGQAATGDAAHPCAQLMEDDQRDGREQQHPEQPVAEVGAEDRIGRDAGRVVVGEAGENSWPDDGCKGDQSRVSAGVEGQRPPDRASAGDGAHRCELTIAS